MKPTNLLVKLGILLTGLFLFYSSVFAQPSPANDNDPRKTGLPELTPEEIMVIENTHPKVIKVKLNKMGLERANEHRHKKKIPLLSPEAAVKDGEEIETITGATSGSTSGELPPSSLEILPDSVDNSTLKYFPPIRSQGSISSCGSFSGAYYAMTYMLAKARDLDAKTGGDAFRLSPKFAYNLVNGGSDSGSWYYWVYNLGIKHGLASWSDFPYDSNYRAWPVNPDVWRAAISRRFDRFGYVASTNTDAGMLLVKQMLLDGYVFNIPTYINSWQYKLSSNDPLTTADDALAGKSVCYWVNGQNGYHAMTVVGYNDHIWVDINNNGLVDLGEKGAFRIANSWGTGWGEAGFAWMAYDALKNPSAVLGAPSSGRTLGWSPATAHWVLARPAYTPTFLGQFSLNHLKRNQLGMTLGVSDTTRTTPSTVWSPSYALSYAGGAYAFNGTTTALDGEFVFDFTDIVPSTSGAYRFYLGMRDSTAGDAATLKSFKLIDVANGTVLSSSTVPQTADGGAQIYARVDHDYSNGNTAPVAVMMSNPTSGYAPVAVSFDGSPSYDSDGTLTGYSWDFGDGVTANGVAVNHTYNNAGNYTARLMVTDNMGGTNTNSAVISVAADPNTLTAPSNLTGSAASQIVSLGWNDLTVNESGYYIERAVKNKGSTSSFQRIGQTGPDVTSYQETMLSSGTFVYRVHAFNTTTGQVSGYSNTVNVRVR